MKPASMLFVLLLLGLGACDDDRAGPEAGPTPTGVIVTGEGDDAEKSAETECDDLSAAEAGPANVLMQDNEFDPACIAVSSTQSVQLSNTGQNAHNFSIGDDVSVDVEPGETAETEPLEDLVAPGTYDFVCRFHEDRGMVGVLIVE